MRSLWVAARNFLHRDGTSILKEIEESQTRVKLVEEISAALRDRLERIESVEREADIVSRHYTPGA